MPRLLRHTHPHVPAIRHGLTALWLTLLCSGAALTTLARPAFAQPVAAPPSQAASLPWTEGEVRKVDTAAGKLTLRHGDIRNLDMPPMTMVFQVRDPGWLGPLKAGDRVRFTADKVNGAYTVMSIEPLAP